MMKTAKHMLYRIMAVILAVSITLLLTPAAFAKTAASTPAADFKVNLVSKSTGKTVWTYTYTLDDLDAMCDSDTYYYSAIDAMPAPVLTAAQGVFLDELIGNFYKKYNDEKDACLKPDGVESIKLHATDNWSRVYTYDLLFGTDRYYYPNMYDTWITASAELSADFDDGAEDSPAPLLALRSYQTRIFPSEGANEEQSEYPSSLDEALDNAVLVGYNDGTTNYDTSSDSSENTALRFCMGMSKDDCNTTSSSAAKLGRWVNAMDIVADIPKPESTGTGGGGSPKDEDEDTVFVTGVTLNKQELSLDIGKTEQLTATVSPSDATEKSVTWSSGDASVASVNGSGLVTALKEGSAVITVTTKDKSKTATCKVTVKKAEAPVRAVTFSDTEGNWAKDNISKLVALGAINGYSDGSFRPNDSITRAEFVTVLVKALVKTGKITLQTGASFDDTKNHWADNYIMTALSYGYIQGGSKKEFNPDDNITREEIAVIIARAFKVTGNGASASFSDNGEISSWALESVNAVFSKGLMKGESEKVFSPKSLADRAQSVTVILRALENAGYLSEK